MVKVLTIKRIKFMDKPQLFEDQIAFFSNLVKSVTSLIQKGVDQNVGSMQEDQVRKVLKIKL